MRRRRYTCLAIVLAAAWAGALPATIVVANGEDLAPVDDSRMIVSSMAGGQQTSGALLLVDTRTNSVRPLPVTRARDATRSKTCSGVVPANAFKPHGIALRQASDGTRLLYVINHGDRESVETFRLVPGREPRLAWTGCVVLPRGAEGNAVAPARDGGFYVTNLGTRLDGTVLTLPSGGEVLRWRPNQGWSALPGSRIAGANGLLLSADEKTVFVAGWSGGTLTAVPVDGGAVRTVRLPFLPDNLRWAPQGKILATGHKSSMGEVAECYMSSRAICPIPSAMAVVDADSLTVECTEDVKLGLATSTVVLGGVRWAGSARNDHIEKLDSGRCGGK